MDSTDPDIAFGVDGVCNRCHEYDRLTQKYVFSGAEGRRRLEKKVSDIKHDGRNKPYDCIIGVSGGIDSTFVAYTVNKLGLKPLAVHLDNGWDSEIAVSNIHTVLTKLGINLHTHVIDWDEFRDLQLAFLKASTPDSEIPSDHAIVSLLFQTADKLGIKYVISGRNYRTETHIPKAWSTGHFDWKYIENVHDQFGQIPLRTYPHRTYFQEIQYRSKQNWFDLLNYIDYVVSDARRTLKNEFNWTSYGGKHHESIYTRFFQGYILPIKFGFDKRRGHFSSLICSNQMEREAALRELVKPTYPPTQQEEDRVYVLKKLGLSEREFQDIMDLPPRIIYDYPSYAKDDQNWIKYYYRRIPSIPLKAQKFLSRIISE
jgi:N-acetyl sugar amidotransferase